MHIWRKVYHTEANISETQEEVDRTVLTLSFNGNEMDVDAMLQLYDDVENVVLSGQNGDLSGEGNTELPDKDVLSGIKTLDLPDKTSLSGNIAEKISLSGNLKERLPMTKAYMDKLADIYIYLFQHPHSSKEEVAAFIDRSEETTKKFLQALSAIGMITPEGGNKNRTYSITQ